MTDIWRTNGGVYFGVATDRLKGEPPPYDPARVIRYQDDRHLITVGPNGSGKSRRLLLTNLAELTGWSMLVIDPKGNLARMTAAYRREQGSRVIILDPFNASGLESDGYNPVAALDPSDDDFPDDAMGQAEAIIRVEGKEPHFGQSAQDLVCAIIMYVRLVLPDPSLVDVRYFLGLSSDELRHTAMALEVKYKGLTIPGMVAAATIYDCPELETKALRLNDASHENRELLSVVSTALAQTRWLDSRPIKRDLARAALGEDAFAQMKERPTVVFLVLPARRLGTHSTWLRLMITSVLQPLMKDTRASKVPVLFMLDEAAALGHLPVIEQTMAMMREYGIKLWTVFQDFAQATSIYGERWPSFLGNAGVLQAFAPQDFGTAKALSEQLGQTTKPMHSASGSGLSPSFSISQVQVPLMLPQELSAMGDGFAVIKSHKSESPLRVYFPDPSELPHMQEICARDPGRSPRAEAAE